jgi:chorismate dehydratase
LNRIRVGAVSYLNTKPLLYGLHHFEPLQNRFSLEEDYPSAVSKKLQDNEIDVGLVPVAVIPTLAFAEIISEYCIGAEGKVASVCLFSQVPLQEIDTIFLDFQSRSSIALCQILCKEFWGIQPKFVPATAGFEALVSGTTAAVIIGDRAFAHLNTTPFVYDLAEAWQQYTQLPFVFAAWVANKALPRDWIDVFNQANALGLQHIPEVAANYAIADYSLLKYYTANISYRLTPQKKQGLQLFLQKLAKL